VSSTATQYASYSLPSIYLRSVLFCFFFSSCVPSCATRVVSPFSVYRLVEWRRVLLPHLSRSVLNRVICATEAQRLGASRQAGHHRGYYSLPLFKGKPHECIMRLARQAVTNVALSIHEKWGSSLAWRKDYMTIRGMPLTRIRFNGSVSRPGPWLPSSLSHWDTRVLVRIHHRSVVHRPVRVGTSH
jgi:hypothetical protein